MDMPINWFDAVAADEIPMQGSSVVRVGAEDIAVFRTVTDEYFALRDRCPHKGGPLSQGIVHNGRVACPLHSWVIELASGEAMAPDRGCAHTVPVRVVAGMVQLGRPGFGTRG